MSDPNSNHNPNASASPTETAPAEETKVTSSPADNGGEAVAAASVESLSPVAQAAEDAVVADAKQTEETATESDTVSEANTVQVEGEEAAEAERETSDLTTAMAAIAETVEASKGTSSELRVQLDVFEGPLDLLLYLIKKDEVDIYDIPIERITKHYLQYIEFLKMLDLEIAGEFLVVAATLLYIKSRTLLPKDQQPPEDEAEEDDPRWDLIRQLVEYKKFKDAAWELQLKQLDQEKVFARGAQKVYDPKKDAPAPAGEAPTLEVGIFDLISAFQKVLDRANQREDLREIFEDRWTVSDKISTLTNLMRQREAVRFEELFEGQASRTEIVVTFLALLELIRMKRLAAQQNANFGEIMIVKQATFENPEITADPTVWR